MSTRPKGWRDKKSRMAHAIQMPRAIPISAPTTNVPPRSVLLKENPAICLNNSNPIGGASTTIRFHPIKMIEALRTQTVALIRVDSLIGAFHDA